MDDVTAFATLFEGSKDAYGTEAGGCFRPDPGNPMHSWQNFVHAHLAGANPVGVYPMLRRKSLYLGLDGPQEWEWVVGFGCVDLDHSKPGAPYASPDDAHGAAVALQSVLAALDICSWIERTRSDGRHVWVFAATPVSAATMRNALVAACDIAQVSTKEVNPKQTYLEPEQVGNYIRGMYPGALNEWEELDPREHHMVGGVIGGGRQLLPVEQTQHNDRTRSTPTDDLATDDGSRHRGTRCADCGRRWIGLRSPKPQPTDSHQPGHAEPKADIYVAGPGAGRSGGSDVCGLPVDGRTPSNGDSLVPRRVAILPDLAPLCLSCFLAGATRSRTAPSTFSEAARLHEPSGASSSLSVSTETDLSDALLRRLSGLAWIIWNEGPMPDRDRSTTLWRLALESFRSGLDGDEVFAVVRDGDNRWGQKFTNRRDGEQRVREIVESAFKEAI